MNQEAVLSDNPSLNKTRFTDPQRLAWGVLLLAFAIFCLIAVTVIVGIDYFLFQSTVPIRPVLNVGRSTVGLIEAGNSAEQVGRNGELLANGMMISTYPQSQGAVYFLDPEDGDQVVAVVTLHNNASATLRQASRPRFEWSRAQHVIDLDNVTGKLSIDIPAADHREVLVNVETRAGAIVNLQGAGQYSINATSNQLSVINHDGTVTLISPRRQQGYSIPQNGRGLVRYADNEVEQTFGLVNLLADRRFESLHNSPTESQVWICNNDPGNSPRGQYEFILENGLDILRFIRADDATTPGRISCLQSFGQSGLNIAETGYNYLILRASMFIEYQSLDACGFQGSECPLTLRIDYVDSEGDGQTWHHGFYAVEADPQANYPLRCSSCLQDHDLINSGAWFTYESPNLLTLLQRDPDPLVPGDETRPASIVGVWFYASGHQYDVRVGEVSLLGGYLDSTEIARTSDAAAQAAG